MKLGELQQRCGVCKIIDYCTDPFETPCVCCCFSLKDIEEEEYKRIAENLTYNEINEKIDQMRKSGETEYSREYQGVILELVIKKLKEDGKM